MMLALVAMTGWAQRLRVGEQSSGMSKIGTLAETMWRNEQTGDWDIGFTEKCAIYDCRLWDYSDVKQKGDKFEVTLISNGESLKVSVGKQKDGTSFLFDTSWSRLEEKIKVPGPGWERFPKRMEVNVTITGDKGMLSCDCFGPNVYHNGAPNDRYTVQYTYFDEWVGLIDEFVDCIRNHKTPLINLKWHRETIQAMLGCYESIQSGKIAKVC